MKAVAVALAIAALAPLAARAGTGPVYAELSHGTRSTLVRVDAATLRILPGPRVPLGYADGPWARSPDGKLVAIGSGRKPLVRIVDLARMREVRDVSLPAPPSAIAWPTEDRLVVAVFGRCCPSPLQALALDPATGRIVARSRLGPAALVAASATRRGLVLLLSPALRIGAARVTLVAPDAHVRTTLVPGFPAGARYPKPTTTLPVSHYATPALAVDPPARHAYVIAHEPQVGVVDLDTFAVTVHGLPVRSLADGGISVGFYRRALWAGDGLIALTGRDDALAGTKAKPRQTSSAFGLRLIDTRTWTVRLVAERTSAVVPAAGGLLATGAPPAGLALYDRDGTRRWRVLPKQWLDVLPVARGHAYVGTRDRYDRHAVRIVDLATGRARTTQVPGALTILTDSAPHVCWC